MPKYNGHFHFWLPHARGRLRSTAAIALPIPDCRRDWNMCRTAMAKQGLILMTLPHGLSFFWAIGMNFLMEVAKAKSCQDLLWAHIMERVWSLRTQKVMMLRTHCQTSGAHSLTRPLQQYNAAHCRRLWQQF